MKFTPLVIADVILIEPRIFEDERGSFLESYSEPFFAAQGIRTRFIQDNHSTSRLGVLRGLHYQIDPKAQAKLVRVVKGKIYDVAVDIRRGSKTFGRYVGVILSAENQRMIYIPEGFAHGFSVLEDDTHVLYKVSEFYSPEHERGILWNDPDLAIAWPKLDKPYKLSEKDRGLPRFKEAM